MSDRFSKMSFGDGRRLFGEDSRLATVPVQKEFTDPHTDNTLTKKKEKSNIG